MRLHCRSLLLTLSMFTAAYILTLRRDGTRSIATASAIAIAWLPVLASPAAGAADLFNVSTVVAAASFDSLDTTGCVRTTASVNASESVLKLPPEPSSTVVSVQLDLFQFDFCTGASRFANRTVHDLEFRMGRDLMSATLTGTTTLCVFVEPSTCVDTPVLVALAWISTGELGVFNDVVHDGAISTSHAVSRPAEAAGSVTVDGVQFTPAPSVDGFLGRSSGLTVIHP